MKKQFYFATWLRTAAMISILLCHFVAQSKNALLNMSAQFFNIGVDLFIILSGFLFGTDRREIDARTWYQKRFKRIFIPYEIFVVLLFAVHAVSGQNLLNGNWIWLALGLQGSVVGVLGAEQTWFITSLLICYAITPLLDKTFSQERTQSRTIAILFAAGAAPLLWALFEAPAFHTLLSLVSYYILAFAVGRYFEEIPMTKRGTVKASLIMVLSFAARLTAHHFLDGTILYERIICGYTQIIAAFCIFYLFARMFAGKKPVWAVQKLSEISFEIYLVHYMFCVGPVRLFGLTPYWVINCAIVALVTIVIAVAVHSLAKVMTKEMR